MEMAAKRTNNDNVSANELKNSARKMGLIPEIRDMIVNFQECQNILEVKSLELNLLESLTMDSDDENVVELREQLFAVTKLLYSDVIAEAVREEQLKSNTKPDDVGFSSDIVVKIDMNKNSILNRLRTYIYKRSLYHENIKKIKKRLKEDIGL